MHQKYTLTISDIEINVISDESPEAVEALVSIVDRKMREISSKSRNCSKAEAAILCSLDYCSDKIRAQRKIKALEAKIALTAKTAYYAKIMGLSYGRITITSAKTRFGSCSSKGNISFSYLLMLYPDEAIDYVVVHELAHLVEMNHSSAFYKIVENILPDYKNRQKLLKL